MGICFCYFPAPVFYLEHISERGTCQIFPGAVQSTAVVLRAIPVSLGHFRYGLPVAGAIASRSSHKNSYLR